MTINSSIFEKHNLKKLMSHSLSWSEGFFHFNGDFSGEVTILKDGEEMKVPFEALEKLVAEKYRREKISEIEGSDPKEILGK